MAKQHAAGDAVTKFSAYNSYGLYDSRRNNTELTISARRCTVVSWGRKQAALRYLDGETTKDRVRLADGAHPFVIAGHDIDSDDARRVVAQIVADHICMVERRIAADCRRLAEVGHAPHLEAAISYSQGAIAAIRAGRVRVADALELAAETVEAWQAAQ